jgi:hypothetical protein
MHNKSEWTKRKSNFFSFRQSLWVYDDWRTRKQEHQWFYFTSFRFYKVNMGQRNVVKISKNWSRIGQTGLSNVHHAIFQMNKLPSYQGETLVRVTERLTVSARGHKLYNGHTYRRPNSLWHNLLTGLIGLLKFRKPGIQDSMLRPKPYLTCGNFSVTKMNGSGYEQKFSRVVPRSDTPRQLGI